MKLSNSFSSLRSMAMGVATVAVVTFTQTDSGAVILLGTPSGESVIGGNVVAGVEFTVGAQNLSVTHLGAYDRDGNGLANSHQVGLWNTAGTLLRNVTVPAGTGATLANNFRFSTITAIELTAGQTYTLGARYISAGGADAVGFGGSASFASGVNTVVTDKYVFSGTLQKPTGNFGEDLWAANMQFTVVPEPAEWAAIAAAGLLGFGVWRRVQREKAAVASVKITA